MNPPKADQGYDRPFRGLATAIHETSGLDISHLSFLV
jgi:hypothetical protein